MKKVMLMILDGWGLGKDYPGNAVQLANTPNFDNLWKNYPHTKLIASGEEVGLPEGQMGNSEVGHLNIGAGRIIYQELTKITKKIKDGSFYQNLALNKVVDDAVEKGTKVHLLGLLSHGGVHSHIDHVFALLELCKNKGVKDVYVHAFLDGRDVSPTSGIEDLKLLMRKMDELGVGKLASVSGRYYAMDRDKRWDRVEKAYNNMLLGEGIPSSNIIDSLQKSYDEGITDEFILPITMTDKDKPVATIDDGDSIIFFNFRPDRARQMTRAIVDDEFHGFTRRKRITDFTYLCLTEYDKTIQNVIVAYPPETYKNTLGEVLAKNHKKQLRIAETEKYAHVTFFFNGGVEEPNENEDRYLVPSPKVATYDLQPEMSAPEVTEKVIEKIDKNEYDVIILNFANGDMVGHTGVLPAAIKAVETVDQCLGQIMKAVDENGYCLFVTADHGNSEYEIDEETGGPFTAHTTNPVPFIAYPNKDIELKEGILADISPTILDVLEIDKPDEMENSTLIKH